MKKAVGYWPRATIEIQPMTYLEEVFKKSGIPTYTFVKPKEYNEIIVSLRTPGRCMVVEGPSGIGKTTCIQKAIEELGFGLKTARFSARSDEHKPYIEMVLSSRDFGVVVIDDFHVLSDIDKAAAANLMKLLADEERSTEKLILIGINKAGDSLVQMAPDLNNRIDTIRFEQNPDEKVLELIEKGESVLNVSINTKSDIVALSKGGFHIAQYLCSETCTIADVLANQINHKTIEVSIEVVKDKVLTEFGRTFFAKAKNFAVGTRIRREGRSPYLHLLYWLSKSDDWSVQIDDALSQHRELKISISQIVDKGYLEKVVNEGDGVRDVIHYDSHSRILTIEDPKFMFYLRNLLWNKFSRQIGFLRFPFNNRYDFALSFAGEDRELAELLNAKLLEAEISVFYDMNEQSRILASNVEDYLSPIYSSESRFVVPLLSNKYPTKIWTKFESDAFKNRFGANSIIPVWYSDTTPGIFDLSRDVGGITFDVAADLNEEANRIVKLLMEKIASEKNDEKVSIEGDKSATSAQPSIQFPEYEDSVADSRMTNSETP